MEGSPRTNNFWAKLDRDHDGEPHAWHPFWAHSLDVAVTLRELFTETILSRRLGSLIQQEALTKTQIDRLAALAALHDAGKTSHGFQNRAFDDIEGPRTDHLTPIINALEGYPEDKKAIFMEALDVREMAAWFEAPEILEQMLIATFAHHGRPMKPASRFRRKLWENNERRNPLNALAELRNRIETWFPRAFKDDAPPFPESNDFQHAYNGVLTLADWLGSDTDYFEFIDSEQTPAESRANRAATICVERGFTQTAARDALGEDPPDFSEFTDFESAYDIQQACRDLTIHEDGSLTILESDTGSGKTEAVIARFLRLYHAGEVDGMYFALPTRSAATELHGRVVDAVDRVFPSDVKPKVVQAVPGYIKVDDHTANTQRLPDFSVRWDDQPEGQERSRRWAAEHSKRYLAGTIAVGTIDQVLLSTLRVSHAHLRASALLRHLLVVDEVHASDPYMTTLLESVIDHHLDAGGHAFLMSATLGSGARARYATGNEANAPPSTEARSVSYPLLTHVDSGRSEPERRHAKSSGYSKEVAVTSETLGDNPKSIADRALKAAREGARVLVIRNLVDDCRETQNALEESTDANDLLFDVDGVVAPHHSRFAPDDRTKLDEAIETTFGEDADNETGVVCVATQTVEQSLDIDADLMITDLAPVDVLLQRIGRLHRHETRERPAGYEQAKVIVLTPEPGVFTDAIETEGHASGPHGFGTVYADLRTLEASRRLIDSHDRWTIPEMNRELVEDGTHPETLVNIAEQGGDAWERHEEKLLGVRSADRFKGERWMLDRSEPFETQTFPNYDEVEEKIKTRLGDDNYEVKLTTEDGEAPMGPFGETVEEVTIPEWMLPGGFDEEDEAGDPVTVSDRSAGVFEFKFGHRDFHYSRTGLALTW